MMAFIIRLQMMMSLINQSLYHDTITYYYDTYLISQTQIQILICSTDNSK